MVPMQLIPQQSVLNSTLIVTQGIGHFISCFLAKQMCLLWLCTTTQCDLQQHLLCLRLLAVPGMCVRAWRPVAGEGQCYAVKDPRHGRYCKSSGGNCSTDQRPSYSSDKIVEEEGALNAALDTHDLFHFKR